MKYIFLFQSNFYSPAGTQLLILCEREADDNNAPCDVIIRTKECFEKRCLEESNNNLLDSSRRQDVPNKDVNGGDRNCQCDVMPPESKEEKSPTLAVPDPTPTIITTTILTNSVQAASAELKSGVFLFPLHNNSNNSPIAKRNPLLVD